MNIDCTWLRKHKSTQQFYWKKMNKNEETKVYLRADRIMPWTIILSHEHCHSHTTDTSIWWPLILRHGKKWLSDLAYGVQDLSEGILTCGCNYCIWHVWGHVRWSMLWTHYIVRHFLGDVMYSVSENFSSVAMMYGVSTTVS